LPYVDDFRAAIERTSRFGLAVPHHVLEPDRRHLTAAAEGKARAPRPGDTPLDQLHNALSLVATRMEELEGAFSAAAKVVSDNGQPLVDARGVDPVMCGAWRRSLADMQEKLIVWGSTFKRTVSSRLTERPSSLSSDENDNDGEGHLDPEAGLMSEWDRATEG